LYAPQGGLFPVADRPERRTIGHCLHIQHRCKDSPCEDARPEQIAVPIAAAAGTLAFLGLFAAVRTRKSTNASRSSTAERHMGRARQASPVPPASDVRVAGSDLPIVAPPVCSAAKYVIKDVLKYQTL